MNINLDQVLSSLFPLPIVAMIMLTNSSSAMAEDSTNTMDMTSPTADHSTMMHHDAMSHSMNMPQSTPIGSLPSSDGAAPKNYDAYGVSLRIPGDPLLAKLQFDNLEIAHSNDGATSQQWDGRLWIGRSLNKLWFRSEGERKNGQTQDGDIEALWGHATSPYWDLLTGIRHDFGIGPERNWAAIGFQGLAPYDYEFEATAYAGPSGRTAFRLKTSQDWLFTQNLILTPELDVNAYGRSDPQRSLGAGISDASLSFRLRYEFSRKFAPYIGYSWGRKFGATASMARADKESVTDQKVLAGIRVWF